MSTNERTLERPPQMDKGPHPRVDDPCMHRPSMIWVQAAGGDDSVNPGKVVPDAHGAFTVESVAAWLADGSPLGNSRWVDVAVAPRQAEVETFEKALADIGFEFMAKPKVIRYRRVPPQRRTHTS